MSKVVVVEIRRQPDIIEVIQSLNDVITSIGVETVLAPSMNAIKGGVLIGFATKLGSWIRWSLSMKEFE
jgi:hypothetical protein